MLCVSDEKEKCDAKENVLKI